MAIPSLLSALKVIPWGDVISHAPSVLEKARDLMARKNADVPLHSMATPNVNDEMPSLSELKNRLLAALMQIDELKQRQTQLTQTVSELAEQNAGLVSAVSGLRQTLRLMVVGLALAFVGLGVIAYTQFF
jgi:phosphoglycerate-specific signal transduction histidine kinase